MSSPQLGGGGVNLVSSTSAGAIGKEVTSADFVSESVEKQAETQIIPKIDAKLTGKANADLSNCTRPYVIETWHEGTEWYRVWSDGWIEQGGAFYNNDTQITFKRPFTQSTYTLVMAGTDSNPNDGAYCISFTTKTTSGFKGFITYSNILGSNVEANWLACGY